MIRTLSYLMMPARQQQAAGRINMVAEWNKENGDETPLEMMPRRDF